MADLHRSSGRLRIKQCGVALCCKDFGIEDLCDSSVQTGLRGRQKGGLEWED